MRCLLIVAIAIISCGCASAPKSEKDVFSHVVQLTSGYKAATEARFSYDMNWVVFQAIAASEEQYQMFIARVLWTGGYISGIGQPIRITPPGSRNACGAFSPDGVSIIFASTAGNQDLAAPTSMEIFRADAWQGAIAATEFSRGINLAEHPITANNSYDAESAFSPDGQWIVFSSTLDADPTRPQVTTRDTDLYAMRSDGSRVVRLTTTDGYDGGAFFSPDGNRIVYRSDRKNNNLLQIFTADIVRDAQGNITGIRDERQLTNSTATNFGPFWHPNGRHIIYAVSSENHRESELYMMRTDGTHNIRISFHPAADSLPVFSPDGFYLIWTSKRSSDQTPQIFVARFKMPAAG